MDASAKILEAIGYGIGRLFRFSYDVTASSICASAQTRAKTIHGFPLESRFEHTHILGGSGHGKTQLLQQLILNDMDALREDHGSIVVIRQSGRHDQ